MAGKSSITDKDIASAFARIEDELLASMMRSFESHRAEELKEGYDWVQWQAVQLGQLAKYTQDNAIRHGRQFDELNARMEELIELAYREGYSQEEASILRAIKDGYEPPTQDAVFGLPEERLNALLRATHTDMMKAEHATLRRAEDIYRQTIFAAQVYATSGAGTYDQAVDMAVKDFLLKGVDGIVYKNGSRHSIREYSQMAIRTATRRAALTAEGQAREDWGIHTIFVNYRADACPVCAVWVGQVIVDDVFSGGTQQEAVESGYALLSDAMAEGLFHPNCKDTSATYFEGINEPPKGFSSREMEYAEAEEAKEQELSRAEQHAREWGRVASLALDPTNRAEASVRAEEWTRVALSIRDMATDETIQWPEATKKITAKRYNVLKDEYAAKGVKIHPSFSGARVDEQALVKMANAAVEAFELLPGLRDAWKDQQVVLQLVYDMDANDFARVNPSAPWKILFNEKAMRDLARLEEEYARLASEGWFVKGTHSEAVVYHELGHAFALLHNLDEEAIAMEVMGVTTIAQMRESLGDVLSLYANEKKGEIGAEAISAWLSGIGNEFAEEFMTLALGELS